MVRPPSCVEHYVTHIRFNPCRFFSGRNITFQNRSIFLCLFFWIVCILPDLCLIGQNNMKMLTSMVYEEIKPTTGSCYWIVLQIQEEKDECIAYCVMLSNDNTLLCENFLTIKALRPLWGSLAPTVKTSISVGTRLICSNLRCSS